uniref:C2H2-type domain-containing protein n=1 Tax=Bionectria ochroleuca TaxID=29856 RepID=A0A0B7KIL1_BIOOC
MTEAAATQPHVNWPEDPVLNEFPPNSPLMKKSELRGSLPRSPPPQNSFPPPCFATDDDDLYDTPKGQIHPGDAFLIQHLDNNRNAAIAQNAAVRPLPPIRSASNDCDREPLYRRQPTQQTPPNGYSKPKEQPPTNPRSLEHLAANALKCVVIEPRVKLESPLTRDISTSTFFLSIHDKEGNLASSAPNSFYTFRKEHVKISSLSSPPASSAANGFSTSSSPANSAPNGFSTFRKEHVEIDNLSSPPANFTPNDFSTSSPPANSAPNGFFTFRKEHVKIDNLSSPPASSAPNGFSTSSPPANSASNSFSTFRKEHVKIDNISSPPASSAPNGFSTSSPPANSAPNGFSTFRKEHIKIDNLSSPPALTPDSAGLPPFSPRKTSDPNNKPTIPSLRTTFGDINVFLNPQVQQNGPGSASSPGFMTSLHPHQVPGSAGNHSKAPISPPDSYQASPQTLLVTGSYRAPVTTHIPKQLTEQEAIEELNFRKRTSTISIPIPLSPSSIPHHPPPPESAIAPTSTYVCTFAGCKAPPFQTQYLLNSHANVHSSARPHYCPVQGCPRSEGGKGFKRKNEMIRHGLVHDSPGYVCPFCPDRDHRYPRPDNLQRHVRVHHSDKNKDDPQLRNVLAQRADGPNRGRRRRGMPL